MVLFSESETEIILKDERYYLRFDAGHFGPSYEEFEVSKEDAESVMQDVHHATQLIWDYQNKKWGLL